MVKVKPYHSKLVLNMDNMDKSLGKQLEGIAKKLGVTNFQQLPSLGDDVKVR